MKYCPDIKAECRKDCVCFEEKYETYVPSDEHNKMQIEYINNMCVKYGQVVEEGKK